MVSTIHRHTMKVINLSAEPTEKLYSWLPHGLQADLVVFFPDACPGRSPLPTGTAVLTRQPDWRRFAVSDCGCGMLLLRSETPVDAFDRTAWARLAQDLRSNKGNLGDLGSGNHFLDALLPYDEDVIYFLIHTGSRDESNAVDAALVNSPPEFDTTFTRVVEWARANRRGVARLVERYFGPLEEVVDRNHNHYEHTDEGTIIRKGSVKLLPGELTVVPSNLDGDVVLLQATERVGEVLYSMCHGTGRVMSRGAARAFAAQYDFEALRRRIIIPDSIGNRSIQTEAPFCYRDLEACLQLLDGYVTEVRRFAPFAYIGQM